MKISVDNFIESVDEWVEQKLLTKGTPIQQGIASFIYFQGKDKLKSYLSALSFLADENGDFDQVVPFCDHAYGTLTPEAVEKLNADVDQFCPF
jgi:hypothetical protein